jgi:hypothetical protein
MKIGSVVLELPLSEGKHDSVRVISNFTGNVPNAE